MDDNCAGGIDEGFDQDADGLTSCHGDCDDANSFVWLVPAEIAGLAITTASPASLAWDSQETLAGPETRYDLVSGPLSATSPLSLTSASCLQSGGGSSYSDTRPDPAAGSGFWYLTRGRNSCGIGTYGTPSRDADVPSCP